MHGVQVTDSSRITEDFTHAKKNMFFTLIRADSATMLRDMPIFAPSSLIDTFDFESRGLLPICSRAPTAIPQIRRLLTRRAPTPCSFFDMMRHTPMLLPMRPPPVLPLCRAAFSPSFRRVKRQQAGHF